MLLVLHQDRGDLVIKIWGLSIAFGYELSYINLKDK